MKLSNIKLRIKRALHSAKHTLGNLVKYRVITHFYQSHVEKWQPDIIHAHDLITLPMAVRAAKTIDARVIYDAHELETHRNPPQPAIVRSFVRHVEKQNIRKTDAVFTVCDPIADYLRDSYGVDRPFVVLNSPIYPPRQYDEKQLKLKDTPIDPDVGEHWSHSGPILRNLRSEIGLADNVMLGVYVGFVTFNRGLETVIEALPQLDGIHFCAVGPRNENIAAELLALANRLGVENRFTLIDPVPAPHVVDFVKDADFGICPIWPVTLSYEWAMPNKLFEMSFAGLPIVASNLELVSKFVTENKIGNIYQFDDPSDLAHKISEVMRGTENYRLSPEEIINWRRKYDWDAQTLVISKVYKELLH